MRLLALLVLCPFTVLIACLANLTRTILATTPPLQALAYVAGLLVLVCVALGAWHHTLEVA